MRAIVRQLRAAPYLAAVIFSFLAAELRAESPYARPIYNSGTKSYFELRDDNKIGAWWAAKELASRLEYEGVRGRLAVVDSLQTHRFLANNFMIDVEAWIGLRYWCAFRKLTWGDGRVHEHGEFAAWAPSWDRKDSPACQGGVLQQTGYMPVYYLPTQKGFKWQAVNPATGFSRYFVEYPTGRE